MGGLCDSIATRSASSAPMMPKPAKKFGGFIPSPKEGELGGDTWGKLPNLFRAGGDTWITGSYDPDLNLTYWGVAQAKPWMRASRQSGNGATLYRQFHRGAQRRHRQTGVVLPSCARRNARSGRSVRARAGGRRRPEAGVQRRQSGRLVEERPRHRQVSGSQGNGVSEHLRFVRSGDRRAALPQRHRGDQVGEWVQSCPTSEGGHNWHAMSYQPGDQSVDHSGGAKAARR